MRSPALIRHVLGEEVGPDVEQFGTEEGSRSCHAHSRLEACGQGAQQGALFRSAPVEGAAGAQLTLVDSGPG